MKRLLLSLLDVGLCMSLSASIEWDWDASRESCDFEYQGVYYGIISESRAEVHVMNPEMSIFCDPYGNVEPAGAVAPEYRLKVALGDGEDLYYWRSGYYKGDIEIPETVEHGGKSYTVVRIAYGAFAWCDALTSVKLPSTLREIRYGAFSRCTSLSEINLPAGVRVCGGAFYGCSSLRSLDFSECEFQYYEYGADVVVSKCESLEEIYLPQRWHKEPFHCYVEEVNHGESKDLKHHMLGDYYLDYDDFPYAPCGEHTETCWSSYISSDPVPSPYPDRSLESVVVVDSHKPSGRIVLSEDDRQLYELQGNNGLRKIHATSDVPMTLYGEWMQDGLDSDPWACLYDDCVLCVPAGSVEAYRTTVPWSNFKNIVEESNASVVVMVSDAARMQPREIYDLSGCLRAKVADGETLHVSPGLYIERCGGESRKLVVR